MRRMRSALLFLPLALLLGLCQLRWVRGDLPIHVELWQLLGTWRIYPTKTGGTLTACGSTQSNKNTENIKIKDYKQYLTDHKFVFTTPFNVVLTDDFVRYGDLHDTKDNAHRQNWKVLAVRDEDGKVIGNWTTIYNEGFEIRIGDKTYTALMHYEPNGTCPNVSDEDSLDSNGETSCYKTSTDKIRLGWLDVAPTDPDRTEYGCFYAEKTSSSPSDMSDGSDGSESGEDVDTDEKPKEYKKMYESKETGYEVNENSEINWHKQKHQGKKKLTSRTLKQNSKQKYACPCNAHEKSETFVNNTESSPILSNTMIQLEESIENTNKNKGHAHAHAQAHNKNNSGVESNELDLEIYKHNEKKTDGELEIEELPKQFTWGDPFNKNAREYEVLNQLKCGSCYVASLLYVFKRRVEIGLTKILEKEYLQNFDDNLSLQSVLSCSFYDQGCHGGYPFLVGKQAQIQGIPVDTCLPYTAADQQCPKEIAPRFIQLDKSNTRLKAIRAVKTRTNKHTTFLERSNELFKSMFSKEQACEMSNRWFVKSYGYIGGCYGCNQCNGEKIMMNEIFRNGPIVSSFEATPGLYDYSDGIYYDQFYPHAKKCTIKKNPFTEFNITGWERVNHAIVLVGWGEELVDGQIVKYWIARNSWGSNWGKEGYFKIIRGHNFNAIESQNVFVDPDFTRGAGLKIVRTLK